MRYKRLAVVCSSLILLPLFSGCIFSPKKGGGGVPPPDYALPITPGLVLGNLALAYSHKDSTEYKSLFDDNYQGTSLDQQDPSAQLLTYTKADEAMHIAGLARSTTVTEVRLELLAAMIRITDAGDPPGWALIQDPIVTLSISDSPTSYEVTPTDETTEFHFRPTLDSSSPTDTTWTIVKWVEVRRR